jgi:hypothetical protein
MRDTKADWMEDTCPRCLGSRADPDQSGSVRRLPDDPTSGERQFALGVVPCRQCNGTGRVSKGK